MKKVENFEDCYCKVNETNFNGILKTEHDYFAHEDVEYDDIKKYETFKNDDVYNFGYIQILDIYELSIDWNSNEFKNKKEIEYINGDWHYVESKQESIEEYLVNELCKYKHKDGGEYILVKTFKVDNINESLVSYRAVDDEREFVRTQSHFFESFTLMEKPWYEDIYIVGKLIINEYKEIRVVQSISNGKITTHQQHLYKDDIIKNEWKPLEEDSCYFYSKDS